ncbi:MAG: hypothetical protein JWM81_515 [Candidatus Saccharibacteria bacterium]|nr:hypothetical protein [Candidatus Saccharibacteria bacterium]
MLYTNDMDLSTGKSSGTQSTTQTPQSSTDTSALGSSNSAVQPGTDTNALNATPVTGNSVPLTSRPLPATTIASTSAASTAQAPVKHTNAGLGALSVLLFITAVILFVSTFRSGNKAAKNTTN